MVSMRLIRGPVVAAGDRVRVVRAMTVNGRLVPKGHASVVHGVDDVYGRSIVLIDCPAPAGRNWVSSNAVRPVR